MNSEILTEIYRAKAERRKRLCQLSVDEKVVIIERLRDMARALRAARHEFSKTKERLSCYDLARDLAGSIKGLPKDIATNPKCSEGFGE